MNNKKTRVAMLGHKRIPSREGGVEIVVEELSTRMVNKNYDVVCFNRSGNHVSGKEHNTKKIKNYKGVKIKNVFTLNFKGLAAMSSSAMAAIKAAFGRFDVVHFHAEGPCAMIWLPKLFGKKCIATIHGLDHQRAKWGKFARWYILFGEKCAVKYANEIIVLSKNVQEYFKDKYGRETRFIPNGVIEPKAVEPNIIKDKFNLNKDDYILFLGRIVPEKGISYLIKAFMNVKTCKKLVIAGGSSDTNEYMDELKQMAISDDRILFTGFVQGELLDELYSNAYIYTLPSDLEGMPLSLLEAMSYNNCCLVSDIPECKEVVESKAVIFKAGDCVELKEKLQWLCDNPDDVYKYKKEAREYICNKYNWDTIVDKTIQLYK